jgi:tRNA(Arg) A34 adenosine deaminase TadA
MWVIGLLGEWALCQRPLDNAVGSWGFQLPEQCENTVVVRDGAIIGYGPSRVIVDRNPDAHAERVALWDAQKWLGIKNLSGAMIYSTSRPCSACEGALALANVERMYFGADGADGGRPRRAK